MAKGVEHRRRNCRELLVTVILLVSFVIDASNSGRVCNVFAGIDQPLFEQYQRNLTYLTDLVQTHFDRVNEIYNNSVFTGEFDDVSFKLSRIQVMFGSCSSFKYENCTENRSKYLEIFDQYNFSEFCLAYMFTYLDFHNNTAGLASVGTMCSESQNSGFVTLLNNGEDRPLEDSVITLAHELGHSLGAEHDEDVEGEDCGNKTYIMAGITNTSLPEEFSNCSLRAMLAKLEQATCLVEDEGQEVEISLCGNQKVEPGEECDCGETMETCDDPCCYPAIIPGYERGRNESAQPCSWAARDRCITPPELFYGIYFPLAFILVVVILVTVFLRHDWTRDRSLFSHITHGNIRIVTKKSKAAREASVAAVGRG